MLFPRADPHHQTAAGCAENFRVSIVIGPAPQEPRWLRHPAAGRLRADPNPGPSNELAAIALETGKLALHFLGRKPHVAMLSHSTKGSAGHADAQRMAAAAALAKSEVLRAISSTSRSKASSRRTSRSIPRPRKSSSLGRKTRHRGCAGFPEPRRRAHFAQTPATRRRRAGLRPTDPRPVPPGRPNPRTPAPKRSSAPPPRSPWRPSNTTSSTPTAKSEAAPTMSKPRKPRTSPKSADTRISTRPTSTGSSCWPCASRA
jgi:hypothetical protein